MTSPTVPSPAQMPRAGLSLPERLRRQEAAHDAADALLAGAPAVDPSLLAPLGELERLAAEQGVHPIEFVDELGPPAGTFTEAESQAFLAAIQDCRGAGPAAVNADRPVPADDERPSGRAATGLNRYQEIRDRALTHALRRYELDDQAAMDDENVIRTADRFADWIRRGYHL